MKRHIQIKDGCVLWRPSKMRVFIYYEYNRKYGYYSGRVIKYFKPLVIEWWLHNIGYYLTKPFIRFKKINALHHRFKDVDLMVDMGVIG